MTVIEPPEFQKPKLQPVAPVPSAVEFCKIEPVLSLELKPKATASLRPRISHTFVLMIFELRPHIATPKLGMNPNVVWPPMSQTLQSLTVPALFPTAMPINEQL